jgi:glycosyltransferase involved in cell wall biosynthesis
VIVAIFAQITALAAGGVGEALLELITGLNSLPNRGESYVLVASSESAEWLAPHVGPYQRIAVAPYHLSHQGPRWEARLAAAVRRRIARLAPVAQRAWERTLVPLRTRLAKPGPPRSDGFIESLGATVVHFPYQAFVRTSLPSIFEPWDLQHRHLPEYFTPLERRTRDGIYGSACLEATTVAVGSDWVRRDVIAQYGIPASKLFVVRRGPPPRPPGTTPGQGASGAVKERLGLPDRFLFCPANTWPHKNHLRLLDAVAQVRDRDGLRIHLVCSGTLTDHFTVLQARLDQHHLADQVSFLGYVSSDELMSLFQMSYGVVVPSLFEGYGFPVLEAFRAGVPVASSNATSLPELVGDAGLTFDPRSTQALAEALRRLWLDAALRATLIRRGSARLSLFDGPTAARTFRALYWELSGLPVSMEDQQLLAEARSAAGLTQQQG